MNSSVGIMTGFPYLDPVLDLEKRVEDLFQRLTFEEKCQLLVSEEGGKGNRTRSVPRLGIPEFRTTDGPHGIHSYALNGQKATYFPPAIQMASTWNPALIYQLGEALAEEIRAIGYHGVLGPGMNIDRTPMNGRTFEYLSEDPYLTGEMAVAVIQGIQSKKIAACAKHFAVNNQETCRFTIDAQVSERAIHELYFPAFKKAVQEGQVWTIMASYNKANGAYSSENPKLLRETLVGKWGFRGVILSDWNATRYAKDADSLLRAGLHVEMGDLKIQKMPVKTLLALRANGKLPQSEFDESVRRYLRVMFRCGMFDAPGSIPEGKLNTPEHAKIAKAVASEGMVLLKNDGNLLPLNPDKIHSIAILGKHADRRFASGGGAAAVGASYEITIKDGLKRKAEDGTFTIEPNPKHADAAIVCVGLGHDNGKAEGDHEGTDRREFDLPDDQQKLILKVLKENPNTIVVSVNGSPYGMEGFIEKVPVFLEAWYGGQELGNVVAEVLLGEINPSGKLPITFAKQYKDIAAHKNGDTFPGKERVLYDESIYVGYRHSDKQALAPRFPFGFGLSYTRFQFQHLSVSAPALVKTSTLQVKFEVRNSGERNGQEVAQLYIQPVNPTIDRPLKELKRFRKIQLEPEELKVVQFSLNQHDLAYYDEKLGRWNTPPGEYKVLVGNSSRDIFLEERFTYRE